MEKFLSKLLGMKAFEKELQLAQRLAKSGATDVEVVGRGAIVTSKEDLASSDTVRLMRVEAKKIVSTQLDKEEKPH